MKHAWKHIALLAGALGLLGVSPITAAAAAPASPAAESSVALTPAGGSQAANGATPNAVDPECILSYIPDSTGTKRGVHISTFLLHRHNIRAAKVNAQIACRRVSMSLRLEVVLWKTGFIFPHLQADQTVTLPKGNLIKNQKTWRECLNHTSTTFYAISYGSVVFQGVTYSASLETPQATLDCGT